MLENSRKIPFNDLSVSNSVVRTEVTEHFAKIWDTNQFLLGGFNQKFEESYAKFSGAKHCIGVGNGLDALVISLKALGVRAGDEVIVPANTFIATALAVSQVGATVVLAEPDENTYNLTSQGVLSKLTKKTKAVIPVHLYGQACELDDLESVCKKNDLFLIEDNAQAQGAQYKGRWTGSVGISNGTSFYPGKNLGAAGDAGAVTTNQDWVANNVRMIRNYGAVKKYHHELAGQNSRLDEIQAAILFEKLKHLASWSAERQRLAAFYAQALEGVGDLVLPKTADGATHVYHLYVVRTTQRDALREHLDKNHIETLIHYPIPIHLQGAYRESGFHEGSFPIAERLAKTSLSLPMFVGMTEAQQQRVVEAIIEYYA